MNFPRKLTRAVPATAPVPSGLVDVVADDVLVGLGGEETWSAVIAAEPDLDVPLRPKISVRGERCP